MIDLEPVSVQILKDAIFSYISDYFEINEINNYKFTTIPIPENHNRFRFMRLSYARDSSIKLFQTYSVTKIRKAIYKEMDDMISCMKDRKHTNRIDWSNYLISIAMGDEINPLKIRTTLGNHPLRFIIIATRTIPYTGMGRNWVKYES